MTMGLVDRPLRPLSFAPCIVAVVVLFLRWCTMPEGRAMVVEHSGSLAALCEVCSTCRMILIDPEDIVSVSEENHATEGSILLGLLHVDIVVPSLVMVCLAS